MSWLGMEHHDILAGCSRRRLRLGWPRAFWDSLILPSPAGGKISMKCSRRSADAPGRNGSTLIHCSGRKGGFLAHSFRTRTDREGRLRVELTRSPHRVAMSAICAFRPAGVDVLRT
jgi:hypothetical protein